MQQLCKGGSKKDTQDAPTYNELTWPKMAPEQPSIRTLQGSTDQDILGMAEQVCWGEHMLALSALPCQQQDKYMGRATSRVEPTYGYSRPLGHISVS